MNILDYGTKTMKVLIALDVSGSVNRVEVTPKVQEIMTKIPSDAEVTIRTFDLEWKQYITLQQLELGDFLGGGGSSIEPVLKSSFNYDYTYVITDGYMDDLDKLPHNSELVLVD